MIDWPPKNLGGISDNITTPGPSGPMNVTETTNRNAGRYPDIQHRRGYVSDYRTEYGCGVSVPNKVKIPSQISLSS